MYKLIKKFVLKKANIYAFVYYQYNVTNRVFINHVLHIWLCNTFTHILWRMYYRENLILKMYKIIKIFENRNKINFKSIYKKVVWIIKERRRRRSGMKITVYNNAYLN